MMITGIGTDLVKISRIEQSLQRFGDKFISRIFTPSEQLAATERKDKARFYAMRFAAKEAAWKALSPGYQNGVGWHDLEITATEDGQPILRFHGRARDVFDRATGGHGQTHVSLSDDGGMALAFVVLSAP
ncbi:MAG: holo-ACP synthase [Alphaproteobacteria bacterium]|nr:holo-ACP synthase [Alphaproteobacteria bacterium]